MVNYDQICFYQKQMRQYYEASKLLHKKLSTAYSDMHDMSSKALMTGVTSVLTEHKFIVVGQERI